MYLFSTVLNFIMLNSLLKSECVVEQQSGTPPSSSSSSLSLSLSLFTDILLDIVHTMNFHNVSVNYIIDYICGTVSFLVSDHSVFGKLVMF